MTTKRLIVGITGASGFIYAQRLIAFAAKKGFEIHLVMTKAAQITRAHESNWSLQELKKQVAHYHPIEDVGASIASGSFTHLGMVILPCSMHTVAEIACGLSGNLLTRAADVCLKERRPLVIVPRETPLHAVHLQNLATIANLGGMIYPPMPAFYHRPQSIEDMVDHTLGRIFSLLKIEQDLSPEWQGWR
jgi:4-hydroxy-3-polyprenylbenzoate decarboxylase